MAGDMAPGVVGGLSTVHLLASQQRANPIKASGQLSRGRDWQRSCHPGESRLVRVKRAEGASDTGLTALQRKAQLGFSHGAPPNKGIALIPLFFGIGHAEANLIVDGFDDEMHCRLADTGEHGGALPWASRLVWALQGGIHEVV
jgi:hypothetical protein